MTEAESGSYSSALMASQNNEDTISLATSAFIEILFMYRSLLKDFVLIYSLVINI